ncbi:MAG: nicotinate-nicotinamide nucleotide adenylyltransferase [Gaiella sp.]
MSIGILGGAFDPPHAGHVALARAAVERFGLERLLVRVVVDPGHKHVGTPAATRLALARLAFADVACAEVSPEPHGRTVDALEALGLDDPLFVIGADELTGFLTWKEPQRVLDLARLAVGTRPGVASELIEAVLEEIDRRDRITVFAIPPHPVSSTALRDRAAAGESLVPFVPDAVAHEIARLRLYRAP